MRDIQRSSHLGLSDGRSYGLTLKKLQEKVSQWLIVVSGVLENKSPPKADHRKCQNFKMAAASFFFLTDLKIIILSDLIVQLYDRNKSCQICHFKQH